MSFYSWNSTKNWNIGIKLKYMRLIMCMMIITVICCVLWIPSTKRWCTIIDYSAKGLKVDSFLLLCEKERTSYDRLMGYIMHPQTPCRKIEILGGDKKKNGQLDGDKAICLEPGPGLKKDCIVYSFGSAFEWSFDEGIREKFGCEVFSFDPSMDIGNHEHSPGVHFYEIGLGDFDGKLKTKGQIWNMKTLDTIRRQLGHDNRTIDVLKIDIEGGEYVVLEDMLNKGVLNHVNHLCIEIHLADELYWPKVHNLLKRIENEAGLRHFRTQNNTQVPLQRVLGFYDRYEQHLFELAWYRP